MGNDMTLTHPVPHRSFPRILRYVADCLLAFFHSSDDIRHIMTTYGETLSKEEVDEMLAVADVNRNGQVPYMGKLQSRDFRAGYSQMGDKEGDIRHRS